MIALDTNILVYAHRRDSSFHDGAKACVDALATGVAGWAIPWPCVHEFLSIVTSPRVFKIATPTRHALAQVEAWMESPRLQLLGEGEGDGYWAVLKDLLASSQVAGPKTHDARIAALALFHGVDELLSADRDFSRFPRLRVRNPL